MSQYLSEGPPTLTLTQTHTPRLRPQFFSEGPLALTLALTLARTVIITHTITLTRTSRPRPQYFSEGPFMCGPEAQSSDFHVFEMIDQHVAMAEENKVEGWEFFCRAAPK